MIIHASAPTRISLFGGGCDVEPFASKHGGIVINCAINLRQHIQLTIGQSSCRANLINEIPDDGDEKFLKHILNKYKISHCDLSSSCDAHLGSGLGTSAAAAVALIGALQKAKDFEINVPEEAWQAEKEMGWFGGKQDQYASYYGGWNIMMFGKKGVNVLDISKRPELCNLINSMVLIYTGKRTKKYPQNGLQKMSEKQIEVLNKIKEQTIYVKDAVLEGNWKKMGETLDRVWTLKKESNPHMSNSVIDLWYERGKEAGALGGKLLGAGAGGYMLFMVDPSKRSLFESLMTRVGADIVDFSFDWNGLMTRIL